MRRPRSAPGLLNSVARFRQARLISAPTGKGKALSRLRWSPQGGSARLTRRQTYVPLAASRTVLPLSQPTRTSPAACWPHPAGRLRTPDSQAASDAKGKADDMPHTPYYCVPHTRTAWFVGLAHAPSIQVSSSYENPTGGTSSAAPPRLAQPLHVSGQLSHRLCRSLCSINFTGPNRGPSADTSGLRRSIFCQPPAMLLRQWGHPAFRPHYPPS
jgi:hypothetical protein